MLREHLPYSARLYIGKLDARVHWHQLGIPSSTIMDASQLYRKFHHDRTKTCHIIASGWSLNKSAPLIDQSQSFIIGFNFSAFIDIHFDLYFIELASTKFPKLSKIQHALTCQLARRRISSLFIKNLWERKVEPAYVHSHYGHQACYIKDLMVPHTNVSPSEIALQLMKYDRQFVYQSGTTAITCIAVAKHIGFKDIVVHGLDFSGPHFYTPPTVCCPHSTPLKELQAFYNTTSPVKSADAQHPTASETMPLLPSLAEQLAKDGVKLYSAIHDSPSSAYLPPYYP